MAVIYLTVAGLGVALLVASVVKGLFLSPDAVAAGQVDLHECERDISKAVERLRSQIPARLAATLEAPEQEGAHDRLSRPSERVSPLANLVTRCTQVANSPADRAIKEAAEALGELERGFRQHQSQFERDVAAHAIHVDSALAKARALLGKGQVGKKAKSP